MEWLLATTRLAALPLTIALAATSCSSTKDADTADGSKSTTTTTVARGADVARPTVAEIPAETGHGPFLADPDTVKEADYVEKEYSVEGQASAYRSEGTLSSDGKWTIAPATTAPYKTRILARYPANPKDFDGTVFVEWFNVTGGIDVDVAFGLAAPAITDAGSAYVGVSAQQVGVEGGGPAISIPGAPQISGLKQVDPARYGDLRHPGDQYSYDIFSQVAQAIRRPDGFSVLGGLKPQHLIAFGESQSAGRLVTYVNAVQPVDAIYDGVLIHSRFSTGAALNAEQTPAEPTHIRDDIDVPILQFETETDIGRGFWKAEPVKECETTFGQSFCMSASREGSLIQATVGSLGGEGRRPRNRSGLAA